MLVKYEGDYAFIDGHKFKKDMKTRYYLSTTKHGSARVRLHRYVYENYVSVIPKGGVVHHVDHDKQNNEPENLTLMDKATHAEHHSGMATDELKRKWRNNIAKASIVAKEWHSSDEGRQWHREQAIKTAEKVRLMPNVTVVCKKCGCKYEVNITLRNRVMFCSAKCRSAFRFNSGVDNELRECVICQTKYSVNKYLKKQTCSRQCAGKLRQRNKY